MNLKMIKHFIKWDIGFLGVMGIVFAIRDHQGFLEVSIDNLLWMRDTGLFIIDIIRGV